LISRRKFIKTAAASGSGLLLHPLISFGKPYKETAEYFCINPFIENNPDAVFIMKSNVDTKFNSGLKKQVGLDFARSVFLPAANEQSGFPLTDKIAIKANLTCRGKWSSDYTTERSMGVVTDVYFVEGVIESMKGLGLSGDQFYIREVNCPEDFYEGGYLDMANRTGADIRDLSAEVGQIGSENVQWIDVPDGIWFKKIPYLWPINVTNTILLNIAKFKTHAMGVTLCAKNLQGTIAHNYQEHCSPYGSAMDIADIHRHDDANTKILANYNRHKAADIPRWDRPGGDGGIWQETWASRCLDNNSVTKPALNIIEGIYGRDGHFIEGPSDAGLATDYMTNIIIFGKNAFYTDIIGHWLAGHEPGNFGLFHLAQERNFISHLNPAGIPLYEWQADQTPVRKSLTDFQRTPLKTMYLQRDYDGQNEPYWHMVDESFAYDPVTRTNRIIQKPEAYVLHQNYPNPFNASTSIGYTIPHQGHVKLEIIDQLGRLVGVLVNSYQREGAHVAIWNTKFSASGVFYYRFTFNGFNQTKKMTLLR
jgi:uncharacterized protein (DUF362 family)